jgi:hypothetical protein
MIQTMLAVSQILNAFRPMPTYARLPLCRHRSLPERKSADQAVNSATLIGKCCASALGHQRTWKRAQNH